MIKRGTHGRFLRQASDEELERMRTLYDRGYIYREIGHFMKWSRGVVARRLCLYYPDREPRSPEFMSYINRWNAKKARRR